MLDMSELLDIKDLPGIDGETIPVYEPLELVEVKSNPNNRSIDLEEDYATVRKNAHFQQQMLMDAAKIFLETAKNADSPRHMEVFSGLMGQMSQNNKDLLKLHKEMKEITAENIKTAPIQATQMNIETAQVFLGSTNDLMDELEDAST